MANYHLPPPEPMVCTGDVATNWRTFTEAFTDYSTATELTKRKQRCRPQIGTHGRGKEGQGRDSR